jgi:hypothetical protein
MLAVSLLTAPAGALDKQDPTPLYPSARPALQALAVRLEILDPREVRYVLARPEDFKADLKLLRRRYRQLADAPPLSDAFRFPDRPLVNDLLTFNRTYRQYLTARQSIDLVHGEDLRAAVLETDQLYRVWDYVRDARCDYYYITVRREALKNLRDMLGAQAFYTGQLPPHVPVWRFQEMH